MGSLSLYYLQFHPKIKRGAVRKQAMTGFSRNEASGIMRRTRVVPSRKKGSPVGLDIAEHDGPVAIDVVA